MNTKLLIYFVCSMMMLCGCELGTDRVYMEMYEAMNINNTTIENSIKPKINMMMDAVKRKPHYKALVPASWKIEELALDFSGFINDLDKRLDKRDFKAINDDEIKGKIVAHRHKTIDILKRLSSNKDFWIRGEDIQELTELHFFPNGNLPTINGKPFDDYSFENQSIACNKAMLAKQKNDASRLAKITIDYLSEKMSYNATVCGHRPVVVSSPKKNFIIKGETFETYIFLYMPHHGEHSQEIEMMVKVDDKELPVESDGTATYKITPIVYGEHTYDVKLSVKNPFNGKFQTYRRTFSFEVGERCYE